MKPLRMCMVCRARKEKHALIRIARQTGHPIQIDRTGILPGRGAYLCKDSACIHQAQKRRALERAFSTCVDPAVYDQLNALTKERDDES